jgi:YggT family protein
MKELICILLQLLLLLVFAAVVVSWFPRGGDFLETLRRYLHLATDWILGPIRRSVPPVRMGAAALDLSPLIVLVGVIVLQRLIRC